MAATTRPMASGSIRCSGFPPDGLIVSAPNRRRRRSFLSRGDVPIDKALRVFRECIVGVIGLIEHRVCDVLGDIARPAFGGIEGNNADGVSVLPRDKISDDRLPVRLGGIGLKVGSAEMSKSSSTRYTVTSLGRSKTGRAMIRSS